MLRLQHGCHSPPGTCVAWALVACAAWALVMSCAASASASRSPTRRTSSFTRLCRCRRRSPVRRTTALRPKRENGLSGNAYAGNRRKRERRSAKRPKGKRPKWESSEVGIVPSGATCNRHQMQHRRRSHAHVCVIRQGRPLATAATAMRATPPLHRSSAMPARPRHPPPPLTNKHTPPPLHPHPARAAPPRHTLRAHAQTSRQIALRIRAHARALPRLLPRGMRACSAPSQDNTRASTHASLGVRLRRTAEPGS
jgi:hypothetical protein